VVQQADVFAKTSEFEHHYLSATCCPIISPRHPTRFSFALTVPQTPPPQGTSFFAAHKTHVLKWKHRPPQTYRDIQVLLEFCNFYRCFTRRSYLRNGRARRASIWPPSKSARRKQHLNRRGTSRPTAKIQSGETQSTPGANKLLAGAEQFAADRMR
jgi:hypothetical protein